MVEDAEEPDLVFLLGVEDSLDGADVRFGVGTGEVGCGSSHQPMCSGSLSHSQHTVNLFVIPEYGDGRQGSVIAGVVGVC